MKPLMSNFSKINSLLMAEAVFTEFSVYPQCRFPGMKAEDAIFRIVRALREVVAHVVSPEGIPGLLVCNDFGCSGQGHAVGFVDKGDKCFTFSEDNEVVIHKAAMPS